MMSSNVSHWKKVETSPSGVLLIETLALMMSPSNVPLEETLKGQSSSSIPLEVMDGRRASGEHANQGWMELQLSP